MQFPWQHEPRRPNPLLRTLAVTTMLVLLLAACGGGTDRPAGAGIYVPADGTTTTEGLDVRTGTAITTSFGVEPSDDYSQIEQLIQRFLDLRNDVILRQSDPDVLAPIARDAAIQTVLADRAYNDEQRELDRLGSTVERRYSWPNLTAIQQRDGDVLVTDCTERQEINGYGQFNLWFVEQRYVLVQESGEWKIGEVLELHNGFLEPDARFGCAPQSFTERAESTAVTMWTEFVELGRAPSGDAVLSTAFGDDLAEQVLDQAAVQAEAGVALTSREQVTFRTVGIDTTADLLSLGGGTTVVVEACRTFPDGLEATDLASGETEQGLPPGAELAQLLYVKLSTGPEGATGPDQVVAMERGPGPCGTLR